ELALARGADSRAFKAPRRSAEPADVAELERLFMDVARALQAIEFFKTRNQAGVMRTMREIAHRAPLDAREIKLLRAMAIEVTKEELGEALGAQIPWLEQVRFLKTGAEAVAAAVRLARVATGRDEVLGCGYHGWLDWCQGATEGVPAAVRGLFGELPFNDVAGSREMIRARAPRLAAVVVEPVIVSEPTREWLQLLRAETERAGAILIFDEIKTAFRLAIGGAVARYDLKPAPDLVVLGKALANGFPLAVVGGRAGLMGGASRTWISSTLATAAVALAAARATV